MGGEAHFKLSYEIIEIEVKFPKCSLHKGKGTDRRLPRVCSNLFFFKVQTQRRALLIPTVPRTLSPIKCGLKASCSVETFLGAHGFKQTTGQKPESIWAHEDCKTFGAWWETPPVSSARRLQLSCTCAKCFAVPPNPFLRKVGAG